MVDTAAPATATATPNPLEPLTAAEIEAATTTVTAHGGVGSTPAFVSVALDEPPKAEVLRWRPGTPTARRARAVVVDRGTATTYEVVVDLASSTVTAVEPKPGLQAPVTMAEFADIQKVSRAPQVWAALQRRGVTDPSQVYVEPWPAGHFGGAYEQEPRRLGRCVFYVRARDGDQPWSRPVQGVVAIADLGTGEVLELIDEGDVPVPADPGRFDTDSVGPLRTDLQPLEIVQSQGPSFTLEGHELSWQRWRLRVSLHPIEGLVLHQVRYDDPAAGRERSVLYRASMAEMVVPYGDPQGQHYWRHVFDEGEVGMGRSTNSLVLGCDCLGEIRYLDAPMALADGSVAVISNAVCIHEEDWNVLWRHHNRFGTPHTDTRRNRRLAISYWATLGNYDYGYFWYLYQDGSIECEVKLTGIVLASAIRPDQEISPYEMRMAERLAGPNHQHFFSWRLDFDVDGTANRVSELDVVADPPGPRNPHGNAFRQVETPLRRESEAQRDADPLAGRTWLVTNPGVRNALGQPVGYQIMPGASPLLLPHPTSVAARRAGFARHHLWVTAHADDEHRAAGAFPNQHPGGAGLPAYVAADRDLDGADVVCWLTVGVNHVARPEEYPVMPVEHTGFLLRPFCFFDRNPALDVPPQELVNPDGHCH